MPPVFSKERTECSLVCDDPWRQPRTSPCETDCPLGNRIQKVNTLLANEDTGTALRYLHSRNPFPGITGRVCPHPCEKHCNRNQKDEAVNIRNLERFAADHGDSTAFIPAPGTGKRVNIVGAGPAGLTAAYYLRLLGHEVSVYERAPIMGGVPRQAIPDFRLPKDVADREMMRVLDSGVRVHTNIEVGRDISMQQVLDHADATLLAVGLWKERILDIPGKEALIPAVAWLQSVTLRREPLPGKRVIILGGGGVAFDCAFTARRLGAEAHIVCLEAPNAMRAPQEELLQAQEEGIFIHNSLLSSALTQQNGTLSVHALGVRSFAFGADGSLSVDPDGTALDLAGDIVICASGLTPHIEFLADLNLTLTPAGRPALDDQGRTSLPTLFAAGEIASGPGLVASAIGSGRRTALAIHRQIMGLADSQGLDIVFTAEGSPQEKAVEQGGAVHVVDFAEMMNAAYHPAAPRNKVSPAEQAPLLAFAELENGFTPEQATAEASRCMHCGHCMACGSCVEACPGHILALGDDGPMVAYPQECWHCGCCRIACPTGSVAYAFPLTALL